MSDTNEDAIRAWRSNHAPSEERDAREQQLREELDALAEVGLHGPDAFAHAASKVAVPREVPWRWPAILFFTGVLLHMLGAAGRSLLEMLGILAGTTLGVGLFVGKIAQVLVLVAPPIAGIAAVMRFAPKLAKPVPLLDALRPSVRIGLVVAMGLFVLVVNHAPFPSSIHRLDSEALRTLNAWYALAAPTYRLVWRTLPFALALAVVVARRRARAETEATFWMLAGLLVYDVVANVSSASSVLSIRIGQHAALAARSMFPVAVMVTLAVASFLGLLAIVVARRLPAPSVILRSRRTDAVAFGLALGSLPFLFRWELWPKPLREFSIVVASMNAYSVVSTAFDVIAPAMLGAALWHLRTRDLR